MDGLIGVFGLLMFVALGFVFSTNRRRIDWRPVLAGLGLQIALGFLLLKWQPSATAFRWVTDGVASFLAKSDAGAEFIFGSLVDSERFGFIFLVKVIPTIIFFSAFISVLYYLGVVQFAVQWIARAMRYFMRTSGTETLSCSGNIFVGQTEAPLLIRPFLAKMTLSELNAVMVGGFATISGAVLAGYVAFGISAHHLIVASVMSAPAALAMAKLMVPETGEPETRGGAKLPPVETGTNVLDAAARGTTDGLKLAANVTAMLIAFLSIVAAVDWMLGGFDRLIDSRLLGGDPLTDAEGSEFGGVFPGSLQTFFGTLFAPIAFMMGCPREDAGAVGHLLGIKICVTEFVAYAELSTMIRESAIGERAATIATYALCGFANFGSIGVQLGGIGALAPERRSDLARLAVRAMFAGAMASGMTATIAGILI